MESLEYCGCAVRIVALDAAAVTDVSPGAVVKIFVALSAFSDFDVLLLGKMLHEVQKKLKVYRVYCKESLEMEGRRFLRLQCIRC